VIDENVDKTIRESCEEIGKRYEIRFLEIGTEGEHVHLPVQSVPSYSPSKIVTTIKGALKEEYSKHTPK